MHPNAMNSSLSLAMALCGNKLMFPKRTLSTRLTLIAWTAIFCMTCHCAVLLYLGLVSAVLGGTWLEFLLHSAVLGALCTFGIVLPVREFKRAQLPKTYLPKPPV